MNKYWSKTFQDTVGKTVVNLSDGAARFKQGWNEKPLPSEASSRSSSPRPSHITPDKQEKDKNQFLRLPVESARKLRWYDHEDINRLVESSTKDKRALQTTIAALRQKIQDSGVSEEDLDEDLRTRVQEAEDLSVYDEGVASVLLVSSQEETRNLKRQLEDCQAQISRLHSRPERTRSTGLAPNAVNEKPIRLQINVKADSEDSAKLGGSEKHQQSLEPQQEATPSQAGTPTAQADIKSALLGKLGRVEEERREYYEEMVRLSDLVRSHEVAAKFSDEKLQQLEATLASSTAEFASQLETANRREQELRDRMSSSQERHAEILRRAQDICLESEERANTFQQQAQSAEGAVKELVAQKQRLEERGSRAEAQLDSKQREGGSDSGPGSRDSESKARLKIDSLEREISGMRGELQRAHREVERLEARVSAAEEVEVRMTQDLQAAESALADRDQLEAQLDALREQIDEHKGEQGKLSSYKKIAAGLEADCARLEEEVVATVRIATNLESRLQSANLAKANAEKSAASSEARAREAEQRVEREVARRLEVIGADESLWPAAAQEALARQVNKLENMHTVLASLQNELDTEQHTVAALQATNQTLQEQLRSAEGRLHKQELDFRESRRQLETKIASLQVEIRDWQRELAHAEAELGQKSMQRKGSSPGIRPANSPLKRGGGGLGHALPENGQDRPVDLLYLKNVLLKFIISASSGNTEQCRALLPAIATLLSANSQEFRALKNAVETSGTSWWPQSA